MPKQRPKDELERPYTSPYHEFSREQRPRLPAGMRNSEREKAIGQMWARLARYSPSPGPSFCPSLGRTHRLRLLAVALALYSPSLSPSQRLALAYSPSISPNVCGSL